MPAPAYIKEHRSSAYAEGGAILIESATSTKAASICSLDGAKRHPGTTLPSGLIPDFAPLNPGYACSPILRAKSNRLFRLPRHIAATGQQACDRNILVNLFPVKADTADLDAFALRRGRTQQARKPRERHAEIAAVGEVDPHGVLVKADGRCRNGHAMPFEYVPGYLSRFARYPKALAL
jgi:hypothetical protein